MRRGKKRLTSITISDPSEFADPEAEVDETDSGKITIDYAPGGCMLYDGPEAYHHGLYLNTHSGSHTGSDDHYKVCKLPAPPNDDDGLSTGAIVGIAVGRSFLDNFWNTSSLIVKFHATLTLETCVVNSVVLQT